VADYDPLRPVPPPVRLLPRSDSGGLLRALLEPWNIVSGLTVGAFFTGIILWLEHRNRRRRGG
jgi:hypothetical protein